MTGTRLIVPRVLPSIRAGVSKADFSAHNESMEPVSSVGVQEQITEPCASYVTSRRIAKKSRILPNRRAGV
jgi:hypothetical protein